MRKHDLKIIGKDYYLVYRENPYKIKDFPYIYRIYEKATNRCVARKEAPSEMSAKQLRVVIMQYEREHIYMGFNDHLNDNVYENERTCPFCKGNRR